MNQKGISSIVIILIIVGVFAIGGGIWYYLVKTTPIGPGVCPNDTKVCADGSTVKRIPPACEFEACPDETADWKTYQNEEYGFEVKYPATIIFPALGKPQSFTLVFSEIPKSQITDPSVLFTGIIRIIDLSVIIKNKPSGFSNLEKYVEEIAESLKEPVNELPSGIGIVYGTEVKIEKINLGNEKGFAVISIPQPPPKEKLSYLIPKTVSIYLERLNWIYILVYSYMPTFIETPEVFKGDREKEGQIVDAKLKYQTIQKILSTFKFTK